MKKILLAILTIAAFTGVASAQKFQIQAGYGGYTQMDALDMADGGHVKTAWGAVTGGFTYRVSPKVRLGATYTFSSANYSKPATASAYYHALLFNGFYDYYRQGDLKLYGHVGLGFDITHMSNGVQGRPDHWSYNQSYFAFQVSPLGAEYNIGSGCNLFGELGFGAQGLLQVGVRVNI